MELHKDRPSAERPMAVIIQQDKVLDYVEGVTYRAETRSRHIICLVQDTC